MDMQKVGTQIAILRKHKGLTQSDLGERLGVTFQSVSKWERGETLPDVSLLVSLANVLETTVDFILNGGECALSYKGKITVADMAAGVRCLEQMGKLLGKENLLYSSAICGINQAMNADIEACFTDDYLFEAFVAEAVIQNLKAGAYADVTDVKLSFKHEHFRNVVLAFCKRYGLQ